MSNTNDTGPGSSGTSGNQGSGGSTGGGGGAYNFSLLELSDFYVRDGLLHPVAIGSIAIIVTFTYLRVASCRTIAPLTIFDTLINIALGSTLAGIVNGNDLSRGMLGLITLAVFQLMASFISSRKSCIKSVFIKPPLIVAFRGRALKSLMRSHNIAEEDLYQALRQEKIWDIREIEAAIIEPTGAFTVYKRADYPTDFDPLVLLAVPGYQALRDKEDAERDEAQGRKYDRSKSNEHDCEAGHSESASGKVKAGGGEQDRTSVHSGDSRSTSSARVVNKQVGNRSEGDLERMHSQSSVANKAA